MKVSVVPSLDLLASTAFSNRSPNFNIRPYYLLVPYQHCLPAACESLCEILSPRTRCHLKPPFAENISKPYARPVVHPGFMAPLQPCLRFPTTDLDTGDRQQDLTARFDPGPKTHNSRRQMRDPIRCRSPWRPRAPRRYIVLARSHGLNSHLH